MRLLIDVLTGSRLYGTNFDNSDWDRIRVYVNTWKDMFDEVKEVNYVNDTVVYELNQFMRALLDGDLQCHQTLWTHPENFSHHDPLFREIVTNRISLLSREILQGWINNAQYYFGRAQRLGRIQLVEKDGYDFMTYHLYTWKNEPPKPFRGCIDSGKLHDSTTMRAHHPLDINKFGIDEVFPDKDVYSLHEDYRTGTVSDPSTFGLFDKDDNLQLIPDVSKAFIVHRGAISYDRKGHEKYKKFKLMLEVSNVRRGYASNSAYHAFRTLECVLGYLKHSVLPIYSANTTFLKEIRTHNFDLQDLKQRFDDTLKEAKEALTAYTGQNEVNTNLVKDIIIKIRGPVELSKALVDAETDLSPNNAKALDKAYLEAYYEGHGV